MIDEAEVQRLRDCVDALDEANAHLLQRAQRAERGEATAAALLDKLRKAYDDLPEHPGLHGYEDFCDVLSDLLAGQHAAPLPQCEVCGASRGLVESQHTAPETVLTNDQRPECYGFEPAQPAAPRDGQPATPIGWVHGNRHPANAWSSLCPECQPAAATRAEPETPPRDAFGVGATIAELARPTPWATIRRAIGVVDGAPADAVQDCAAGVGENEPPECDNCGATIDGHQAATSDVCWDCWRAAKARTEAEQAVLDAMAALSDGALRWLLDGTSTDIVDAATAELTRRGLKP